MRAQSCSQDRHSMQGATTHTAHCNRAASTASLARRMAPPHSPPYKALVGAARQGAALAAQPGRRSRRCGWVPALVRACRAAARPDVQPPSASASRASAASSAAAAWRAGRRVKAAGLQAGQTDRAKGGTFGRHAQAQASQPCFSRVVTRGVAGRQPAGRACRARHSRCRGVACRNCATPRPRPRPAAQHEQACRGRPAVAEPDDSDARPSPLQHS